MEFLDVYKAILYNSYANSIIYVPHCPRISALNMIAMYVMFIH